MLKATLIIVIISIVIVLLPSLLNNDDYIKDASYAEISKQEVGS
jgi:hypothetical protein